MLITLYSVSFASRYPAGTSAPKAIYLAVLMYFHQVIVTIELKRGHTALSALSSSMACLQKMPASPSIPGSSSFGCSVGLRKLRGLDTARLQRKLWPQTRRACPYGEAARGF
jgi:hypothetical protein